MESESGNALVFARAIAFQNLLRQSLTLEWRQLLCLSFKIPFGKSLQRLAPKPLRQRWVIVKCRCQIGVCKQLFSRGFSFSSSLSRFTWSIRRSLNFFFQF